MRPRRPCSDVDLGRARFNADDIVCCDADDGTGHPTHRRGTFNTVTGTYGEHPVTVVYAGPCRIRPATAAEGTATVGDLHETVGRYIATFPHDVPTIEVDDFVTVTDATDPDLIGYTLRVLDAARSEWLIDRRVTLEVLEQVKPS